MLFLVDDLGQQDVSVPMLAEPSALNARYRPPNLERLAARGVRCSNAYAAAPVCTPSRTAIITGQSPARTHITYWTLNAGVDQSAAHPTVRAPTWCVDGLQPSDSLLPMLLRRAGYRTIHVGKAHFGARDTRGADPLQLGFDVNIAGHAAGAPGSYLGRDHFKDHAAKKRGRIDPEAATPSVWDVPGLNRWHGTDAWLDDALAQEACGAIADAVAARQPFFLNFCPYGVHTPLMTDERFRNAYQMLDDRECAYGSMVTAVDDALGTIVARCEALGVLDHTLIVFTSDNGGLSAHARGRAPDGATAHTHNAPLRSGKGSAYDGGLRVPFVAAGPGIPARPSALETPIVGTDLYPTLLAFASAPRTDAPCDGVDLRPLLTAGAAIPERTILFHQPHAWGPHGPGIEPFTAIRRGDWKLIWFHDPSRAGGAIELYDAAHDPAEQRDHASDAAAQRTELLTQLRESFRALGAQPSINRMTDEPVLPPAE